MMDEIMNNEDVKAEILDFQHAMTKWCITQTILQMDFVSRLAELGLTGDAAQEIMLETMGKLAKDMAAGFGDGDPNIVLNGTQEFVNLLKD